MLETYNKVLVLGAHTDDGEFGCGGTIAKLIEMGKEVHYLVFSWCEESVPEGWPKDILKKELMKATAELGIPESQVYLKDYKVRKFNERRQDILEDMVALRNQIKPDLVLTISTMDVHQDHEVISRESIRAFKNTTVLGYEFIWNNLTSSNTCFVELNQSHLDTKIAAVEKYETQKGRPYSDPEFIKSSAIFRGVTVQMKFAEMFEVIRLIIR
jgi:LmbE family N-acetylglucosaminyl deacetylase